MVMTNKMKFNKKYKQPLNTANGKNDIVRLTGIPKRILDVVYDRGLAAHKNNPQSVRNVKGVKGGGGKKMSAQQWSMARIYAFVMKGKTYKTADSDLATKLKKLKIKGYMR
jgi:hypothetical protein